MSALALARTAEKNRAVYLGITFIAFILIILTRSRMPFISCIMGSAVYWGLATPKRHQSVLLFLGIIIVGCSIYFLLGNLLFIHYGETAITLGRGARGMQSIHTLTGRIPLWKAVVSLVNQRPFLGYGYDSFLSSQNLVWIIEHLGWVTANLHSGYIATLGGLGYIGFVALVLILIISVTVSIRLAKRNSEYAFVAGILVWLIFNLYTEDQILTRPYFSVFVWMIMLAKLGFIREKSRRITE